MPTVPRVPCLPNYKRDLMILLKAADVGGFLLFLEGLKRDSRLALALAPLLALALARLLARLLAPLLALALAPPLAPLLALV